MLHNLWSDLRYATRSLKHSPGFSAAAIVTIALGVGVNTGIFSVLNGVLFRGLPAPDAHELVSIYQTLEGVPEREGGVVVGLFSTSEYQTYSDRAQTLSGIMGHSDPTQTTLGGEAPQEILGAIVTCSYFEVLRQPPAIGRGLSPRDCETGAEPVVVLGHELWATTFGADPQIVGRTVELNRQLFTVVGVASEGTYGGFLYRTAYFAPISAHPLLLPNESAYENDQNSWLFLVGRRNDRASLEQARAELDVIAAQIDQQQPNRLTTLIVERATPLSLPLIRGMAVGAGAAIMTAFGLILLIACANVANLLLARATGRSREIAVRLALGASRTRVIQQLLAESVLISVAGGALGSLLALWSFQALIAFALPSFSPVGFPPLVLDPSPDIRVLSLTLALTFGTGVLFGLAPALHASKPDLHTVIKQDSSGGGRSRGGGRLQGTLAGVQVALCMVLMIGAGLLLRGLYAAHTAEPGFVYRDVAYASYDLQSAGYDPEEAAVFRQRLMEEVNALPGVETVAYAAREPLGDDIVFGGVRLPSQGESESRRAELNWVTSDYFSVVGIPIVRGRNFIATELANDTRVAIVTETTARNYWPGQDPIGQTLLWRTGPDQEIALQVVGVAKDAQVRSLGEIDPYYMYLPARVQEVLLVRSRADFGSTVSGIQAAVRALDPGVVVRVNRLETNLEWWRNLSGVVTALAVSLGTLALGLAAVGIYGVVSYVVSRRLREIGIRIALGARAHNVLGLIMRQTMRPVVVGALIGLVGAVAMSGILSTVLFGVSPVDPIGLSGATLFVICVALGASILAGRRGTRVDTMATLRNE
jgi:predicted permease